MQIGANITKSCSVVVMDIAHCEWHNGPEHVFWIFSILKLEELFRKPTSKIVANVISWNQRFLLLVFNNKRQFGKLFNLRKKKKVCYRKSNRDRFSSVYIEASFDCTVEDYRTTVHISNPKNIELILLAKYKRTGITPFFKACVKCWRLVQNVCTISRHYIKIILEKKLWN